MVGANHFGPQNTKVAKAFANTPGPKLKGGAGGSAGNKNSEQAKLQRAASLLNQPSNKGNKNGTFGVSKRITDEKPMKKLASEEHQTNKSDKTRSSITTNGGKSR